MDRFIRFVFQSRLRLLCWISTIYMYAMCRLWGVRVGKDCRFWGTTVIYKESESIIIIENECRFRSSRYSNLVGINRCCVLSTLTPRAILTVGTGSGLSGVVISCFVKVELGRNVLLGANCLITDGDWHSKDVRSGAPAPVVISDNVWVGEGAKILKGVTIGTNSIIAAGSVVTRDIPANVMAAGNPCRVVRLFDTEVSPK